MTCPNVRGDTTQYCILNCTHDALRPTCPTCNGNGSVLCECMGCSMYSGAGNPNHDGSPDECPDCYQGEKPCTDCTDGRMPFERMAAIVQQLLDFPLRYVTGIVQGESAPEVTS